MTDESPIFQTLSEQEALSRNLLDAVGRLKGIVGSLERYAKIEAEALRVEELLQEGGGMGRLHKAAGVLLAAFASAHRPFAGTVGGWRITIELAE